MLRLVGDGMTRARVRAIQNLSQSTHVSKHHVTIGIKMIVVGFVVDTPLPCGTLLSQSPDLDFTFVAAGKLIGARLSGPSRTR